MSEQAGSKRPGIADLESEHAMQYKLLSEVERLLGEGDAAAAREVAWQLYDYSQVHFGSEEVLMRLHAYPGYQAHLREHGELLNGFRQLLAGLGTDPHAGAGGIRRWLSGHVHHADQEFEDYARSTAIDL